MQSLRSHNRFATCCSRHQHTQQPWLLLGRRLARTYSQKPQSSSDAAGTTDEVKKLDPSGFLAPEGERNLWWVEKFEERRKQQTLGTQSPALQQPLEQPFVEAAVPKGAANEPNSTAVVSEQPKTATQPEAASPAQPSAKHLTAKATLQVAQLSLLLAALILYPAATQPAGLYELRIWLLFCVYWVFFALGTLRRMLKFGDLVPRSEDKQRSTWGDRIRLMLFIISVVLLHWAPVARYTGLGLYFSDITMYEVIGLPCLAGALWLNDQAAKALGAAWDRVTVPLQLVTTGIYKHVQHPIYTSYMLLFFGFAMVLHSAPTALLMLLVCTLHYQRRTALEAEVLMGAFGEQYKAYVERTKKYLPGLI